MKLKKQANELLQAAAKVYHYRRDVTSNERLNELDRSVGEVKGLMEAASKECELEATLKRLDQLLRKIGGKIYPKTFWSDNIEVALVAAIIVIGIRTFFFQPFIIPTNSMFPTYSGMNSVIYNEESPGPSALTKLFRVVTLGARHKSLVAENSGKISLPFLGYNHLGEPQFYAKSVPGKRFFVLPAIRAQYTIFVDGKPHQINVPAEFADMNKIIAESFFLEGAQVRRISGNDRFGLLELDDSVDAGEDLVRFDITLGDMLFVDRLSYHFREPKAGDPFVFRTDSIQQEIGRFSKDNTNKYYIKRIGGVGGETLEIRDGALLVDGEPRSEADAFVANQNREGQYGGYINLNLLGKGREMTIPENHFVSLGDNSGNSLDSRYWGFVPEKSVIGKAIFIYFPFTKRWGLAD